MNRNDIRRALATQRGMTLIEIMVVVAIISLILGGVGVVAFNSFNDAQISTARNQCGTIAGAIDLYRLQKRGKCPKSLQDLKASGFIKQAAADPWGNDYEFSCENNEVEVISGGPDGEIGTEDDLSSAGEAREEE
ncbi:MAG: type II secretion system protein GspG [Nannocystaceae bacterium]|nr:type II secretion system protein GspG [Nannocystaceae bacterium]